MVEPFSSGQVHILILINVVYKIDNIIKLT